MKVWWICQKQGSLRMRKITMGSSMARRMEEAVP